MDKNKKLALWNLYHENTRHFPHIIHQLPLSRYELADLMRKGRKSYPTASRVKLKPSKKTSGISLEDAISGRRSTRDFSKKAISFSGISSLLQLSYGVSGHTFLKSRGKTYQYDLRTAPSAGALYSCELYLTASNIRNLKKGVYHYSPEKNELEILSLNNVIGEVMNKSILEPAQFKNWSASLIITGRFNKAITKYGERGYRYILLDAGHIGQNIYLAATGLHLGVVGVCGFYDNRVNDMLSIDGQDETALYVMLIGQIEHKQKSKS